MANQPDDIPEGARSIRPYLSELVGAEAETVDRELGELLARSQAGERVDNLILRALARHDSTREWMAQFLEQKIPPQVERSYQPLPGSPQPIPIPKYACPQGDFVWFQHSIGDPIPSCPYDGSLLELVDEV